MDEKDNSKRKWSAAAWREVQAILVFAQDILRGYSEADVASARDKLMKRQPPGSVTEVTRREKRAFVARGLR